MQGNGSTSRSYALADGTRVFRSGDEIRFRKGVWSYTEAIVSLVGQGERVRQFFSKVYEHLLENGEANTDAIAATLGASSTEYAAYCELLENLKSQKFLSDPRQKAAAKAIAALFGGNVGGFEDRISEPRPVLFFSDAAYARDAARSLASEIGLPLDVLDDETIEALATADLTTRTDAVESIQTEVKFKRIFQSLYSCVLGCVAAPNLSFLRNLNRIMVRREMPMILGMIDGPFISVLSTLPTETGCFECYEQRMLARLEDTLVYHQFVESTKGFAPQSGPSISPALHILTAAVLSEGYIYSSLGMQRLAGRIINVYLPLLEIQVQDLLRVPYCPACGFVSTARMHELYTSTKRLVGDILNKIEIEG